MRYLDSFVGNFDDVEIRRQALDFLIEKIYVYDDRLVVNFYYSDDKREINFEEFKKYIENLNFIMSEIDGFGSSSSAARALRISKADSMFLHFLTAFFIMELTMRRV